LTQEYKKVMVAECNNVGSQQMQTVRKALRGKGIILMGKNTVIRKALTLPEVNPKLKNLVPFCKGKICLIFTNGDLKEVRDVLTNTRKGAPAKAGQMSTVKVVLPAQNTGMEPTKTSFFQALEIPTRITKGTVEIINDFTILEVGMKVGNSEAALLALMGMQPFSYGLNARDIYDDGTVYSADVLDTSAQDMMTVLTEAITKVACLSLGTNTLTAASASSVFSASLKDILAVSVATNVSFKQSEKILEFIKNPSAFKSSAPVVAAKKEEPKKEVKKEEKKEEKPKSDSDAGTGFGGMFGDDNE